MLSQIFDEVIYTRKRLSLLTQHLRWAIINSVFAFIIYLDFKYGSVVSSVDEWMPYIRFPSIMSWAKCLFILNALFNVYKYLSNATFYKPLCVNPVLKRLCRIRDNEPGFITSTPSRNTSSSLKFHNTTPTFSPSAYKSSSPLLGNSLPLLQPLETPLHTSFSPLRNRLSQSTFHDISLPLNLPKSHNASMTSEEMMEDASLVHSFIQEERSKEEEMRKMESAMHKSACREGLGVSKHSHTSSPYSPHNTSSFSLHQSSPYLSSLDLSLHYDLARPPHNTSTDLSSPGKASKNDPLNRSDDTWASMGISQHLLDLWTERLRKYIRESILSRVVHEIHTVNKTLQSIGMDEHLIGSVSLAALKQLELNKSQLVANLPRLLPFLNLSNNQLYLIPRIKELCEGACMSSFRWSSGGSFNGKKWEENLPSDAAILMHLLCTYLDSCLPSLPRFSLVGSFTGQHYIKKSDKPLDLSHYKEGAYLQEVSVNPPLYDVIYNSSKLHIKKGRDNFFHSILMFFYLIKTNEHGLLRRVSLGLNGINLLWIFDN